MQKEDAHLRDVLVELANLRARDERMRRASEALAGALETLVEERDANRLPQLVVERLGRVLGTPSVAIRALFGAGAVEACSGQVEPGFLALLAQPVLLEYLGKKPMRVVADIPAVVQGLGLPPLPALPELLLCARLQLGERRWLVLCAGDRRLADPEAQTLFQRFLPVFAHALQRQIDGRRAEALAARERETLLTLQSTLADLEQARDQAESASRAKSAFLANMSHELRTPMNGVMGMIEMAKRRMLDPVGLDQLHKAKSAADRLLGVLNDILDLSKIEADRMVIEHQPLQLAESVNNLTGTLGHKAEEKALGFIIDLPEALANRPLQGDALRLGQILLNLVGNAIKFTDHGEVVLCVRSVGETDETEHLRFEVRDSGIGIDAEAQARLFRSFEQADNSMTRKYGGTGLGLAICKRLVHLMGGEIGVDSVLGHGSTFWFVVPFKKIEASALVSLPPVAKVTAEQRLAQDFAGTLVLLAEDEPITQEVSLDLLKDVGLVVDVADNGQEALDLARQRPYALILMDMQMPVMNGVEATLAIRAESLNRTTPILAITANAFDEDREACLEAGMNDHIPKPVDPHKLYATMLLWLAQTRR